MSSRFENWDKFIDPRIERLIKEGFYLEAFYLCSATIEHMLQISIKHQELLAKHILKKSNLKISETENLEDKTLGQLIRIFSSYILDQKIVSNLNSFNSTRTIFVHKVLDHDIDKLNNTAKSKLADYFKLVKGLGEYSLDISNKLIKIHKRRVK